jgi:hypothetical protein
MVAGDKNISGARQLIFKLGANGEDLAGFGSHGKRFVDFALNLARMAFDTLAVVMKQIIFTHDRHSCSIFSTVTKV